MRVSLLSTQVDLNMSVCSQIARPSVSHSAVSSLHKSDIYIKLYSVPDTCTVKSMPHFGAAPHITYLTIINSPAKPRRSISVFLEIGPKHVA